MDDKSANYFCRLGPLSENLLLSLNEDYLDIEDSSTKLTLKQGDILAVIPPISGG